MIVLEQTSSVTATTPPKVYGGEHSVFSGWLLMFSIGMVLGPLIGLERILEIREHLAAHPLLQSEMKDYLSFGHRSGQLFLTLQLIVAFLFFLRSKMAPMAVISLSLVNIILACVAVAKARAINLANDGSAECASTLIVSAIWSLYFLLSKRVKQTFVH